MKNFTKQFANKTLFKPTRWLLVALMFLLGTSGAWAWTVYYDNSATKWSTVYLVIGHDSYRRGNYTMTKVSGYDNLYSYTATDWTDAKYVAFSSTSIAASSSSLTGLGIPYYIFDANMTNANNKIFGGTAYVSDKAQLVLNDYIGFYIGEPTSWNQSRFFIWKTENSKNSYQAGGNTAETQGSNKLQIVYAKSGTYSLTHSASWAGVSTGAVKAGYGYYIGDGNAMKTLTPSTAPSYTFKLQTPISQGSTSTVSSETGTGKSMYGTKTVALDSYYIQKSGESTFTKITKSGSALQTQNLAVGTYQVVPVVYDGKIYFKGTPQTLVIEQACTPSTSITSATLNQDGTISLVGNFTTCGTQYHGFQWRIKGQDWCAENDPNSNSDYVTKQTDVDGEDTDTFTPKAGNTYEFRTYIYGSPWVYSSGTKEVEVPCPTINAPTFSVSSKIACNNVAFNLNDLFPRTDSGAGTLEWYKKDGTKVADPTSVSISATTQYYAVLKDGLCSSANSSNVTVNIYTPAISNIKITPYSYGITVQATIAGSDLQNMIVECIEKGGDWANAKKCDQSLKGSGPATCSIEGLVAGSDYQVRISANTKTCSELFTYSAVQDVKTTCDEIPDAPDIITSGVVCPNTNITLSDYNNGIDGVKWYSNPECTTPASATVSISSNKKYYARIEDGGCASDASTLSLTLYPTPQTPVVTISPNPVGQNKPTTLTVGEYNGTLNNYTLYKDGDSQGAYTTPQTITIGEIGKYDYYVVATSKACPSLTATSETVTLEVLEAGAKIVQLGDLTIYTNIKTDFVPMYVQKDGIVDVDGATSVKGYTWQYSQDGNSWSNCTTNYASGVVGMSNGGADCNNWRADKAGRYRCLITYNNDGTQYSNVLSVSAATQTAPAVNAFGDLPIISVNTGSKSFPSDAGLSTVSTDCGKSRYPSIHADDLKAKISVDVKIYDKDGKLKYDRKARMNYRGSSSLNFKKKSYAFVTGKEKTKNDKGDVDTGKANLFGLSDGAEDKDWVLYAATPDPSMMRNRLAFDLYKLMRPQDWGVNSMYVELIVNNEYRGVYVLMDKITQNDNRVKITSADGFIVKFDKTDVVDRVENKEGDQKTFATSKTGTKGDSNGLESYGSCIDQRFEIEYPEKDDFESVNVGSWEPFTEKVKEKFEAFETALEKKDYTTVRAHIDYDSWADWFILTEFMKNQDGFRASCIFVYNGDKIEARPLWDQELSFNNGTRVKHGIDSPEGLLITTSSVYEDSFKAPFWFTGGNNSISGGLLSDPCFVSLVKEKWATYTQDGGVLTSAKVNEMVDDYEEELGAAAKGREATRWPYNEATRGTTTDGDYIGYYNFTGNNPEGNSSTASSFNASRDAINSWVSSRSTDLEANSGLGKAINALEGEALIFTMTPSVEVTPWQIGIINIHAPAGYTYTVDFSQVENAGGYVTNDNATYSVKLPRPSDWEIGGNGDNTLAKYYEIEASIELDDEGNTCGVTATMETKTATITLKDEIEACDPIVTR